MPAGQQSTEAGTAIDVYLQWDGIKGESTDERHKAWIECESLQWAVQQLISASSSTAGGYTVERCIHRYIVVGKLSALSAPILLQSCVMGRTIPKGRIELMRADGNGDRVLYFEIELENRRLKNRPALAWNVSEKMVKNLTGINSGTLVCEENDCGNRANQRRFNLEMNMPDHASVAAMGTNHIRDFSTSFKGDEATLHNRIAEAKILEAALDHLRAKPGFNPAALSVSFGLKW